MRVPKWPAEASTSVPKPWAKKSAKQGAAPQCRFDKPSADASDAREDKDQACRSPLPKPSSGTEANLWRKRRFYRSLEKRDKNIEAKRLRYRRSKEERENDKKNTFLPKRHTEVIASVPKWILTRKVTFSQEDTMALGLIFRYFWDLPPWLYPINTPLMLRGKMSRNLERNWGQKISGFREWLV